MPLGVGRGGGGSFMGVIYHDVFKEITLKKTQECVDSYEAGPWGVICGPTVTVMCSTGAIKLAF